MQAARADNGDMLILTIDKVKVAVFFPTGIDDRVDIIGEVKPEIYMLEFLRQIPINDRDHMMNYLEYEITSYGCHTASIKYDDEELLTSVQFLTSVYEDGLTKTTFFDHLYMVVNACLRVKGYFLKELI